ncbi:MAG: hypothetical protein GY794_24030 [bacterium]|nr:hypothetical protein [bacterium]
MYYVLHPVTYVDEEEAAQQVVRLMRLTKPDDWTRLYSSFRNLCINSRHISKLASQYHEETAIELLGVASLNHDGRIRQAAVEEISRIGHPRGLPYILLRLADWVPQVRSASEQALEQMFRSSMVSEFFRYSFLIKHLERIERVDLSFIRQRVYNFLRSDNGREELEANLSADDAGVRLFCYDVLDDELPGRADLIEKAVRDSDPRIRRWIGRFILDNSGADTDKWLRKLLRDRCSRVQTEIIRNMSSQMQSELSDELQELIFADAPSVRGAARFVLRKHGQSDFATDARQKISNTTDENVRPGWIAALGETGTQADYPLAKGFLPHPRVKVRAAAFAAIVSLDRDRALPTVLQYLNDPNRRIRSIAVATLVAEHNPNILEKVVFTIEAGTPKGQIAAFTVLVNQGGWEVIPYALEAVLQDNEHLTRQAWQCISQWHERYFHCGWIKPTKKVLSKIEEQLARVESSNVQAPPNMACSWNDIRSLIEERR